jgi:hypothetical protein
MTEAQTIAPAVASAIQTASDAIVTLVTLIINTTGDITLAIEVTTIIAEFLNTATDATIAHQTTKTELITTVTTTVAAATPSCTLGTSTLGGCKL